MVGLQGQVRATYEGMRASIIESMSLVEALIDFGEDEGISETVFDRGEIVVSSFGIHN
jgi:tRNA modification GTPase